MKRWRDWLPPVLAMIVLAGLMATAGWVAHPQWRDSVAWGDAATWVNALLTGLALIAAGWAVKRSGDLLRVEHERDRQRTERDEFQREGAERADQADLLAAWSYFADDDRGPFAGRSCGALVVNGSPLPVYDVTIRFFGPEGDERAAVHVDLIIPGETFVQWPRDLLRPGEKAADGSNFRVALTFRDSAQRVWTRDELGQLQKVGTARFAKDTLTLTDDVEVTSTGPSPSSP